MSHQSTIVITEGQKHALKTLCYFDVFSYPLRLEEINEFSVVSATAEELDQLVANGMLSKQSEFYYLPGSKVDIEKRLAGNQRAKSLEKKAFKKARFIGKFPFVRGVSLSGSMSKGYMDEDADLDFFIVTVPGRLWMARTLLIAYKKIFLLNSRKYFCVNYFVDTEHMEIEEKNQFTATEVVTLRNGYGGDIHQQFQKANNWAFSQIPQHHAAHENAVSPNPFVKRTLEKMFRGRMGERMDSYFMKMTLKRWDKKFGVMESADFDVAFKSRKYLSKHHPSHFQKRVLDGMNQRIERLEKEFNISLD